MKVTTVGLDLAKQVFSVHGVDEHGKAVLRKRVPRGKVLELFAQLPPSLVGMEACSGAHYWARALERLGHRVGMMAARFVAPYRKGEKSDGNDADWKNQLLERAAAVLGETTSKAQPPVDLKALHAKICELALENDFLEGALIKGGMLSAKR